LTIAVDFQGFAGKDLNLEVLFLILFGQVDDLTGEAVFGLGIRRDVFEFGRVGEVDRPAMIRPIVARARKEPMKASMRV
jgi:hypothetical protein